MFRVSFGRYRLMGATPFPPGATRFHRSKRSAHQDAPGADAGGAFGGDRIRRAVPSESRTRASQHEHRDASAPCGWVGRSAGSSPEESAARAGCRRATAEAEAAPTAARRFIIGPKPLASQRQRERPHPPDRGRRAPRRTGRERLVHSSRTASLAPARPESRSSPVAPRSAQVGPLEAPPRGECAVLPRASVRVEGNPQS